MGASAIEQLERLLAGEQRRHSASVRLPASTLDLSIEGVGAIRLPASAAHVGKLIAAARPAAFGRGTETLHDASVRDTWEVTPEQVRLGGAGWETALDDAMAQLASAIGIRRGAVLRAELHSLLVYGKGQFFAPHQDSEKHDGMVATLVVSLPSAHTGGELVIDDGGTLKNYAASRSDLVFVAFFADRRHEVLPVRSGHRIALTFDLILEDDEQDAPPEAAAEAAELLRDHFAAPLPRSYGRGPRRPDRIAFLLDHEYTRHALAAGRLKGQDADRVAIIAAAAASADLQTALAQTEVHETWDAGEYGYDRYDDYPSYDDEGELDDADGPDPSEADIDTSELGELIDGSTKLTWWTDATSGTEINLSLADDEVCAITPSSTLRPYASEYEGYMGNYGNTVDRWYRRAALVVWPADRAFAIRAEADPGWALDSLRKRIDAGDLAGARTDAASLEPFWRDLPARLLAPALKVASGLGDPAATAIVLRAFRVEQFDTEHAGPLAALAGYDTDWWDRVLGKWDRPHPIADERAAWVAGSLWPLIDGMVQHKAAERADHLVGWAWAWLLAEIGRRHGIPDAMARARSLEALGPAVASVLSATGAEREETDAEREETVPDGLREFDDSILPLLLATLRAYAGPGAGPGAVRASMPRAARLLAGDARERLERILGQPPRDGDDWSIGWRRTGIRPTFAAAAMASADEEHLATYLASPTARIEEWPLAQARRQHIHRLIDEAGLPVRHWTRRTGRPYTLVLEKTRALFTREAEARARAEADLDWLGATFRAGTETP